MYHKNILNIHALCHLSYNYKLIGKTDLEGCQTQQKSVNKNSYYYWFVLLVVIINKVYYMEDCYFMRLFLCIFGI